MNEPVGLLGGLVIMAITGLVIGTPLFLLLRAYLRDSYKESQRALRDDAKPILVKCGDHEFLMPAYAAGTPAVCPRCQSVQLVPGLPVEHPTVAIQKYLAGAFVCAAIGATSLVIGVPMLLSESAQADRNFRQRVEANGALPPPCEVCGQVSIGFWSGVHGGLKYRCAAHRDSTINKMKGLGVVATLIGSCFSLGAIGCLIIVVAIKSVSSEFAQKSA